MELQDNAVPDNQDRLKYWLDHLTEREMPAFAQTARLIASEASRNESSASELARLILQDASMTTRLLRMANSIYHNPNRSKISTISRAIVLLGFKAVRSLCLSISIIDSLPAGGHKDLVSKEMARAFHAASQARMLAAKRKDKSPEEVFIATLLYQLGNMAFWCFADEVQPGVAGKLRTAIGESGQPTAELEREVIGFSMTELTAGLNEKWQLSQLLSHALNGKRGNDPRVSNIELGHDLARAAEGGWDSSEVKPLLERIGESLYMPIGDVTKMVHANAKDAASIMSGLGAAKVRALIPVPAEAGNAPTQKETESTAVPEAPVQFLEPDRDLQFQIFQELSQLMEENPDINLMLEMVLEGIHRGIGMDRTLFALLTPDRRAIRAKYTLGWDRQEMAQQFHFRVGTPPPSLIDHVLTSQEPLWFGESPSPALTRLLTPELQTVVGSGGFLIMPVGVQNKPIGLFYADRRPSKRPLDKDSFNAFKLFGQQAKLGLSYLKGRG